MELLGLVARLQHEVPCPALTASSTLFLLRIRSELCKVLQRSGVKFNVFLPVFFSIFLSLYAISIRYDLRVLVLRYPATQFSTVHNRKNGRRCSRIKLAWARRKV